MAHKLSGTLCFQLRGASLKGHLTDVTCVTVALLAGLTSGCSVGTEATPVMNPTPRQPVLLELALERKPAQARLSSVQKRVVARYESRVNDCGVITYPAGSVHYPMHEVALTPDALGVYRVWIDLIQKDRCNWKFTMLTVTFMEGAELAASAGFTTKAIAAGHESTRCIWKAPPRIIKQGNRTVEIPDRGCGQYRSETNSDTTVTLRVKDH